MNRIESWGRYPRVEQRSAAVAWSDEIVQAMRGPASVLPYGMGRSYGDSCLNPTGVVVTTTGLNHLLSFDPVTGVLRAEAGVRLDEILAEFVPRGWFVPVSPGTRFVTLGGALANDIHGKNHHGSGSFGHHVQSFELVRSDGSRRVCSRTENADWFRATVGGLGLTGLVSWIELKLIQIETPWIDQVAIRFGHWKEFFSLSKEFEHSAPYSVAWVDVLSRGARLGRGHYLMGAHSPRRSGEQDLQPKPAHSRSVPFDFPSGTLNRWTVQAFNTLYYWRQPQHRKQSRIHYEPFFYPLDGVLHWNRIYGKRGFLQYQLVVPFHEDGGAAIAEILDRTARSGQASFLAVMKTFGAHAPEGMLTFPRPGVTLTLDFPVNGAKIFSLLDDLDRVVLQAGGALYPAKDARMSAQMFRAGFPRWKEFSAFIDPQFLSGFWRRIGG